MLAAACAAATELIVARSRAIWIFISGEAERTTRGFHPVFLWSTIRRLASLRGRGEETMLTTTVGSYPVPDWLAALPSEQSLLDATRVVFDI